VSEHVDVLIVGAGLSGIGAAHHIQAAFPDKTYAILEARDAIGGTWDLFRYPGVRSDSDMYTLGYRFRPWTQGEAIADGDYAGQRVVVIGSGATAVTLVPAMALTAGHVTMLQRSPSYILTMPTEDPIATRLRTLPGTRRAYAVTRPPWRLGMSYAHDVVTVRHGKINDGSMRFSRRTGTPAPPEVAGFTAGRTA
jgi:cation diffusion facilitator CzcD-associated flavoprotein CzcO